MNWKTNLAICTGLVGLFGEWSHAQMGISNDGVTFPDGVEQTAAVIVPMNCPHGNSIVWDSNAESWVCANDLSPKIYALDDTGPAGGNVFYVTDGGLHGLEAAPVDQGKAPWGCSGTLPAGADQTAIGTGAQNTQDILNGCGQFDAARIAENYWFNGYSDWFLPSKDELNQLYLRRGVVGGFVGDWYWSSSGNGPFDAWIQLFTDGGDQAESDKDAIFRVRAVRAF